MACNYYIKLPNGGELKISAKLQTLENVTTKDKAIIKEIEDLYKTYKTSTVEDKEKILSNLDSTIRNYLPALHTSTVRSIVENSTSPLSLINNLNQKIEESGTTAELVDVLKTAIFKDVKFKYKGDKMSEFKTISFSDFYDKLKAPIHLKYFEKINAKGLMNIRTQKDIMSQLKESIFYSDNTGFSNSMLTDLQNVISALIPNKEGNRNKDLFYNIIFTENQNSNEAVLVNSEETGDDIVFYNDNNHLSLFNGVFKMGAVKYVTLDKLLPILEEYNANLKEGDENHKIDLINLNVRDFFAGLYTEEAVFPPQFNKLFGKKEYTAKVIPKIINALVEGLELQPNRSKTVTQSLNNLFSFLNATKFGNKQNKQILEYLKDNIRNKEIFTELQSLKYKEILNTDLRDFYYFAPTIINRETFSEIYDEIQGNISLNKDLIKVELERDANNRSETSQIYIIPDKISFEEDKIFVKGHVLGSTGNLEERKGYIYNKTLTYRKLATNPEIGDTTDAKMLSNNIITIKPHNKDKYLEPSIAQKALTRGALVVYEYTNKTTGKDEEGSSIVAFKIPGGAKGNLIRGKQKRKGQSDLYNPTINLNRILRITTSKSLFYDPFTDSNLDDKQKILDEYEVVNMTNGDVLPAVKGDVVQTLHNDKIVHNTVMDSSNTDVTILIKIKEGKINKKEAKYYIKQIPKTDIKKIFRPKTTFNLEFNTNIQIKNFKDDYLTTGNIKKYNFSVLDNYAEMADGDYLINKNLDDNVVYKIFNKGNNEFVRLKIDPNNKETATSHEYIVLDDLSDFIFITDRNITTKESLEIADINNRHIVLKNPIDVIDDPKFEKITSYVIRNDNQTPYLLNSGNLIGGHALWGNNTPSANEIDKKEELKELIRDLRNDVTPLSQLELYFTKVDNYHVRYNKNYYKTDFQVKSTEKSKLIVPGAFVQLQEEFPIESNDTSGKQKYKLLRNAYRVNGIIDGHILKLEYSTFSDNGKLISFFKTLDLDTQKDSIKWLWVLKESEAEKKIQKVEQVKEKQKIKKDPKTEKQELLANISTAFRQILDIEIINDNSNEFGTKKAWIETDENGQRIKLNNSNRSMSGSDILHEYLHLFLMAVKYDKNSKGNYEELMYSFADPTIPKTKKNIYKIEEAFVEKITEILQDNDLEKLDSFDKFKNLISGALTSLNINPDLIDNLDNLEILNLNMNSVFSDFKTSAVSDKGLIVFESSFRNWLEEQLKNKQIKINCK